MFKFISMGGKLPIYGRNIHFVDNYSFLGIFKYSAIASKEDLNIWSK